MKKKLLALGLLALPLAACNGTNDAAVRDRIETTTVAPQTEPLAERTTLNDYNTRTISDDVFRASLVQTILDDHAGSCSLFISMGERQFLRELEIAFVVEAGGDPFTANQRAIVLDTFNTLC